MAEELSFPDPETSAAATAAAIGSALAEAIDARGHATLAVSGGRTPERVLPLLAGVSLPWHKVTITLTDERWVPPDHQDSNEGLARRLLLRGPAAAASFVGLYTGAESPWAGQAVCEARLAAVPLPLDLAWLGMGPDGHVASLFPGETALLAYPHCASRCVAAGGPEGSHPRMSLSPCLLMRSRKLFLTISGPEKRAAYEAAKQPGGLVELPVRLVLHQDRTPLTVFLAP